MNLREIKRHLQANILAGNASIVKSPPGYGKSQLMMQVAKWFLAYCKASNPNARVGIAFAFIVTASPITFTGMPWKGQKLWTDPLTGEQVTHTFTGMPWKGQKLWTDPLTGEQVTHTFTDHAVPVWFLAKDLETGEVRPASMFDKVFLVLEEWGQGSAEAKRAAAEILLQGGTPPFYLPEGSARVALSNHDARDGVTKEFDHIINRVNTLHVGKSAPIWDEDFAAMPYRWQGRDWQVQGVSRLWAKRHPEILFEDKPKEQGPWCSPRSFTSQDRYAQTITELNNGEIPFDDAGFTETMAGYCGQAQTQSVLSFYKFKLELPAYESIVADPMGTAVPTKADLQMLLAYELAGHAEAGHLKAILRYIDKKDAAGHGMPRDISITFVSSLLRRDYNLLNAPGMDAWIAQHSYLMGIIGKLARN
jgi:hypothetical protein